MSTAKKIISKKSTSTIIATSTTTNNATTVSVYNNLSFGKPVIYIFSVCTDFTEDFL